MQQKSARADVKRLHRRDRILVVCERNLVDVYGVSPVAADLDLDKDRLLSFCIFRLPPKSILKIIRLKGF